MIIGGSLILHDTAVTSLPENLTVGGGLDLSGTGITSLPKGLVVGGSLNLNDTGITELPEDLKIGGELYLNNPCVTSHKVNRLRDGDYAEGRYLYADVILTHVKRKKILNGYTYFAGKIPGKNAVCDGKHYAHCKDLREGIADLLFKAASDRGADQYKNLPLDEEHDTEELATMYRVITGACRQGTQAFVDGLGDRLKTRCTIREAIALTKGQYGSQKFAAFFGTA